MKRGCCGRDRMIVGFLTTYAISAYHQLMLWVQISIRARCTALCDKVSCAGRWFPPVSFTNKIDHHYITEILLKMALNTIKQTSINNINGLVTYIKYSSLIEYKIFIYTPILTVGSLFIMGYGVFSSIFHQIRNVYRAKIK